MVKNAYGPGWDGRERQWRYCAIRSAWSWSPLVTEAGQPGGDVDFVSVGNVALSGIYAAYATSDQLGGGRYGTTVGLTVTNVLTGVSNNANMLGDGLSRVVLAPPFAAWIAYGGVPGTTPVYWFVQTFDGRTGNTTLVDSTCPSAPLGPCDPSDASDRSPFVDLQLVRCLDGCPAGASTSVVWSRNGAWRFAPIG